ncbi:MAG: M23 family metallopeptidase [Ruminococcaceae bacterium]|nr:M23 family metallopeptidase [Oscillospiraceae bacterium]
MSEIPTRRPISRKAEPEPVFYHYPRFGERLIISGALFALCFCAGKVGAFQTQTLRLKQLIHTHTNPQTVRMKTEEALNYCETLLNPTSLEVGAQSLEDSTRQYEIKNDPQPTPEAVQVSAQTVFSVPLQGIITSQFGERTDPLNESAAWHTGLDIAANTGTPIQASACGEVIYAGELGGYGLAVKICHPDGLVTLYGHCSELFVAQGQQVVAGDTIAAVGSTGRSTGPHLHFEIIDGTQYLNPADFLSFV